MSVCPCFLSLGVTWHDQTYTTQTGIVGVLFSALGVGAFLEPAPQAFVAPGQTLITYPPCPFR